MLFAWQGWKMQIPHRWNPVRLEGDYDEGYALIADLQYPRLGIRWKSAGKRKFDPEAWGKLAIAKESGVLAANESQPLPTRHVAGEFAGKYEGGRLYTEPKPPGRDIWVAVSPTSGRTVQVVYHAQRRDTALARRLLPTFCDQSQQEVMEWAAFDLRCAAPAGWTLRRHRLNVGDLALTFGDKKHGEVTVRQIALATLALKRLPLEGWIDDQIRQRGRHYRPAGTPIVFSESPGLRGMQRISRRKRRFFYSRSLPATCITLAVEDADRDRLVIVDAPDLPLARRFLTTVSSPLAAAAGEEQA
jgi:hypothetical protein